MTPFLVTALSSRTNVSYGQAVRYLQRRTSKRDSIEQALEVFSLLEMNLAKKKYRSKNMLYLCLENHPCLRNSRRQSHDGAK